MEGTGLRGVTDMTGPGNKGTGSFGVLIARTASTTENPLDALRMALAIRGQGRKVGVFLVADGVYLAKMGKTPVAALLGELITKGARVVASPEHLKAAGLPIGGLVPGIEVAGDTYRDIVEFVMEDYDKVVVC